MTKRFKLQLCSNGIYYVYENGTLTDIDFDKFNKESADALIDEVNALYDENEQLKQELKVYRKLANCSNCKYHNYDWDINDGYGGEEYEVCDKGNDVTYGICEEWEEL